MHLTFDIFVLQPDHTEACIIAIYHHLGTPGSILPWDSRVERQGGGVSSGTDKKWQKRHFSSFFKCAPGAKQQARWHCFYLPHFHGFLLTPSKHWKRQIPKILRAINYQQPKFLDTFISPNCSDFNSLIPAPALPLPLRYSQEICVQCWADPHLT